MKPGGAGPGRGGVLRPPGGARGQRTARSFVTAEVLLRARVAPSRELPPTPACPANGGAAPVMPASGFPRRGPMGARGPAGLGVRLPASPSAPMGSCRVRAGGCASCGAADAAAGGRGAARRRSGPGAAMAGRMARAPRWMLSWMLLACCLPHAGTRPGRRGGGRDVGGCRSSACCRARLGR